MQPACIACQGTITPDNAMAGDHYGNGILTIGRSDSANGRCRPDLLGKIEIGDRFAKRDLLQGIPDLSLKGSAMRQQGKFKGFSLATEVFSQLPGSFFHHPPM